MSTRIPSPPALARIVSLSRQFLETARRCFENDFASSIGDSFPHEFNTYVPFVGVVDNLLRELKSSGLASQEGWPIPSVGWSDEVRDAIERLTFRLSWHVSQFVDQSTGHYDSARAESQLVEIGECIRVLDTAIRKKRGLSGDTTNSYVDFDKFGQLLLNLESSERAYQANMRLANRQRVKYGSGVALHAELQAAAFLFQPNPARQPGIDRIEALVLEEWGSKLTAENVRRLKGRLCRKLQYNPDQVDALTMIQAADYLQEQQRREPSRDNDRYISFSDAVKVYSVSMSQLTKWADAGHISDNSQRGRGKRKIDAASLVRYLARRDSETDDVS
jgi:hypothetical protein